MIYSNKISLIRNGRGVYCLDTVMGCESGMKEPGGCYNDCYAARAAKRYGFDFTKSVLRDFKSEKHRREIVHQINRIKLPFVRIGCSGDPSENWQHTFKILKGIKNCNKEIVIITRHWSLLTNEQLKFLSGLNICINTSISALDKSEILFRSLNQYDKIKPFCKSVLRIISCDFNLQNETGHKLYKIQEQLFKNESIIDTVFRPTKNNKFILDGVINVKKGNFLGTKTLISKYNKKTYVGKCDNCKEMCGVNLLASNSYPNKPGIVIQATLL